METKTKDRPACLADFYPYIHPGAVCYCPNGNWLFAGFPFKKYRPGCLILRGRAAESPTRKPVTAQSAQPGSVPFRNLEILRPDSASLEEQIRDHLRHGFQVLEQPVTLEDLIRRNHLPLRYPYNLEIETQLHAVLRDLRFMSLTTENLIRDAVWG